MTSPQNELLEWYRQVARPLPWRATRNPYRILVKRGHVPANPSRTGDPILRIVAGSLSINEHALIDADIEHIHRIWKGLGYPSRAERLQAACKMVIEELDGVWPNTPESLQNFQESARIQPALQKLFAPRKLRLFHWSIPTSPGVYARRDGLATARQERAVGARVAGASPDDLIAYNNALMELWSSSMHGSSAL